MLKKKILRDKKYLRSLKQEPCILTGLRGSVDAAHIGTAGKGIKSPDDEVLPIAHDIHMQMHNCGEVTTLREQAPDWLIREAFRAYAREMYQRWREENVGT